MQDRKPLHSQKVSRCSDGWQRSREDGVQMAIKDKNGKVYKLRGPNPLTKDQADWDKGKTKLINLSWQSEIVEDERNPVVAFESNLVKIDEELGLQPNAQANTAVLDPEEFIKEIQEPEIEPEPEPELPKPEPEPEPKPLVTDARLARIIKERGVEYFCAPAIGKKTHMDSLYGSTYETIQYGDKFVFDAVLIDQSDLQLQFWCVRPLTIGSIIYRKIRDGGERWWRIKDIEPKTGGYLVVANVSDTNPDFS